MTVMQARETRVNFILAMAASVIGLAMWVFGLAALAKGLFLPEYLKAIRGSGGALLLVGLIWLILASLKPVSALRNLLLSGILAILALAAYMAGSWIQGAFALPLKEGGLAVLVIALLWVLASLGKLMFGPSSR